MQYITQKYKIKDDAMKPFIDENEINALLENVKPKKEEIEAVIKKSLDKNRLSMDETAVLINAPEEYTELIKNGAKQLKNNIYGDRIVLFAPLYIGNYCQNNCSYCGFKNSNKDIIRKTLMKNELIKEVSSLEDTGHKRLILVFGEHQMYSPEFIADTVKTVYSVKKDKGEIRRVNINAAPQEIEGFKTILEAGIGTYQVFQETYHPDTYKQVHKSGKKRDYDYRLTALDRAMEAGIDDVGIGALFGIYDWRFEALALVRHVNHFEEVYKVGPHTISFPRVQIASDTIIDEKWLLSDEEFTKLVAVLRLAVPYTGMILTARESVKVRQEVLEFGVSQIDGGTNIELGGYSEAEIKKQNINNEQFQINDSRTINEIIHELLEEEYLPSFCTACYRLGRTGQHFMEFSVPGFIKKLCSPNAILTLAEYLEDYAPHDTKELGYRLIDKKVLELSMDSSVKSLKEKLELVKKGKRDLYF